ncbi:PKD domain-containing protein [Gaoshiqia sp. Z1-71]|uniref:PKD domain-containing protein n=1 Tax=Gaoshiqia hydrogeniformans TaxID=3290090 RepID=UPI003BF8E80A
MKQFLLTLFYLILLNAFTSGQDGGLQIKNPYNTPLRFCKDSVAFSDGISITGDSINGGLKISIANYSRGEDFLKYSPVGPVLAEWDEANGTLFLKGKATAAEYQEAVRNIQYVNLLERPTPDTRHIAITLTDVDFLPSTGHFYQFIDSLDITWTRARAEAETKNYYGLQGYLATILSKEENDFIWTKVNGVGWIGASDAAVEGDWRWVTGPEAGTLFWRGLANGVSINGLFSFWSSGEPTNAHGETNNGIGEDYAHINQNPDKEAKSWNDLRDGGDGTDSRFYRPRGYIIEYGGMAGDPVISLSASLEIEIRKIIFDDALDQTICQYDTVRLNRSFPGDYEWFPKDGLDDPFSSNPKAYPLDSTSYKLMAHYDGCIDSAFFKLHVKPVPALDLGEDTHLCSGESVRLDAGKQTSYRWNTGYTGQALETAQAGYYQVYVTNEYGCSASDAIRVTVHEFPEVDLTSTDTLYCGLLQGELKIEKDKGDVFWWSETPGLIIDSPDAIQSAVHAVSRGAYQVFARVTDDYGCMTEDSLWLHFNKIPDAGFSVDSMACYGYNLQVHYLGDATPSASYNWYFPDTLYASGIGLSETMINLGYGESDKRELGLMVSENGCSSEIRWEHIKITPNLKIIADHTDGCEPLTVRFEAETTEPIDRYTWYFGDNQTGEYSTPEHTYLDDGFYDVGLWIRSAEGCENFGLIEDFIKVRPIPTVETDIDPGFCYPHQFNVNYTGSGNNQDIYDWDLSALDAEEIVQNPGQTAGPLTINLQNKPQSTVGLKVISSYGCASETEYFSFKRKPWVNIAADKQAGCAPFDVVFTTLPGDQVDELSYSWNFGQGETVSGEAEMVHTFTMPDAEFPVYVWATSALTGCPDTVWLENPVYVYPQPVAGFEPDQTERIITNPLFHFSNSSRGASFYYWDFGDGNGYSDEFEPQYAYEHVGWFTVQLVAENEELCTDTVSRRLLVAPDRLYPPNGFSPNSSNPENHVFLLSSEAIHEQGYHMQIFNRWGELIFESKNKDTGWDAKMKNGQGAPAGSYIWVLSYQDVLEKQHRQTGTVTLVY